MPISSNGTLMLGLMISCRVPLQQRTDFSVLCSRPGFMRPPGEIPIKVLINKGFLAMRSHASKSCLSIKELAGTQLPPCQLCLDEKADEIVAKTSLLSRTFTAHQPLARLAGRFG